MQHSSLSKSAVRAWRGAAIAFSTLVTLSLTYAPAFAVPTLDEVADDFGLSKDDLQRVRNGELVNTTTKETSDRELAVVIVFLVKVPVQKVVGSFKDGPSSSNDPQIQSVTEISAEGALADLNAVVLQPGGKKETQRYLNGAAGDTLNLSIGEIASTFVALKASGTAGQPQVEDAVRQLLLSRYQAYRDQGLAGIAPYARAEGTESQPADDLRRGTEAAKGIKKYAMAFYDFLMNFPQDLPAGLTQHFFCIRYAMSGRPNFVLRQHLAMPIDDAYVVADRDFYVSNGYNDTQIVAGLIPIENGTVVVYLARANTDQLGGFGASVKRSI
jgi:hypothetical protein